MKLLSDLKYYDVIECKTLDEFNYINNKLKHKITTDFIFDKHVISYFRSILYDKKYCMDCNYNIHQASDFMNSEINETPNLDSNGIDLNKYEQLKIGEIFTKNCFMLKNNKLHGAVTMSPYCIGKVITENWLPRYRLKKETTKSNLDVKIKVPELPEGFVWTNETPEFRCPKKEEWYFENNIYKFIYLCKIESSNKEYWIIKPTDIFYTLGYIPVTELQKYIIDNKITQNILDKFYKRYPAANRYIAYNSSSPAKDTKPNKETITQTNEEKLMFKFLYTTVKNVMVTTSKEIILKMATPVRYIACLAAWGGLGYGGYALYQNPKEVISYVKSWVPEIKFKQSIDTEDNGNQSEPS